MENERSLIKKHFQDLLTQLTDAYYFYSRSSAWTDLEEVTFAFLGCANVCRKISIEIVASLKQIDPDAKFDTDGSLVNGLQMGWTDIKISLGIETRGDLIRMGHQRLEKLQHQLTMLEELHSNENERQYIAGLNQLLSQQERNLRNL
ncbi:hypothetical protein [Nonlabens xiamenensis]|uniref:hypothetical protein n=1 Tax=Nonlabens xiamenensis TaxID=2341043 RepID=UPI000F6066E5|nr:hypothetical protein [Nonlabens xiamenensis]